MGADKSGLEKINSAYKFKLFDKFGVAAAFTNARENFSFRHGVPADVLANRSNFLGYLSINYKDLVCLKQVHSGNVIHAGEDARGRGADSYESAIDDTDALFTDKKNIPLAIFLADCLGVYFFDPEKKVIALAHAGWRGSKAGIVNNLIKDLIRCFGCRPEDLIAAFSPAIRSCCYEVGASVAALFKSAVIKRGEFFFFDLIKENRQQLLSLGLKDKNIIDCQICTSCRNAEFFSFRKEGENAGRAMAVMMIK